MTIETILENLSAHEAKSQARYEDLTSKLQGNSMTDPVSVKNIFETNPMSSMLPYLGNGMGGAGAGAGAGLGAGLVGGMLGGALFGGNGFGGRGNDSGVVTPALLASSLDAVTSNMRETGILSTLGDIKASIPLAEGQVQLALAGSTADINRSVGNGTQSIIAGQTSLSRQLGDNAASILASEGVLKETVLVGLANNMTAILNNKFELSTALLNNKFEITTAVRNDGDATRALIVAQNDAMLNRELATAQAALLEQRAIGRSAATEVNVSQVVNQAQAQNQAQQQQQQQAALLAQLCQAVHGLQVATATNQSLIIGNTGAVTGGAQTANPVNVRA